MKLVYAVREREKPGRPAVRHLDDSNGRPMCGGNGREPFVWASEEGQPTCKICMDLAMMGAGEPSQPETGP